MILARKYPSLDFEPAEVLRYRNGIVIIDFLPGKREYPVTWRRLDEIRLLNGRRNLTKGFKKLTDEITRKKGLFFPFNELNLRW